MIHAEYGATAYPNPRYYPGGWYAKTDAQRLAWFARRTASCHTVSERARLVYNLYRNPGHPGERSAALEALQRMGLTPELVEGREAPPPDRYASHRTTYGYTDRDVRECVQRAEQLAEARGITLDAAWDELEGIA